jgi:NitT/TauT family transport system substrate-binding protein
MRALEGSFMRPAMRLLLVVACLCASAWGARAQTSPAVIRIATPGNDGNALAYYAQDTGTFKKFGIDSHIETLRAGSGSGVAAAVAGGSADIGEGDIVAVAAAREHGIPLTLLAPSFQHRSTSPITALVVAKNGDIRGAKDLNGKIIAEPSLTGPAKIATVLWLRRNGADPQTVKFVEMPQISMAAAVTRGTVAAAATTEPNLTAALDDVQVLGYVYDAIGSVVQVTAWFSTEAWADANPDAARRFVAALRQTAIWANDPRHHAQSGAILERYISFPPELLAKMHRATYGEAFETALMQPLLDAALEQHSLQARAAARQMLSKYALIKG